MVVITSYSIHYTKLYETARSTQRAKEVGVRKVIGANRGQLIAQFMGESILLTAFAMLLALAIVEVALPAFAAFVEKPIEFSIADPRTLALLVVATFVVGIV